MAKKTEKMCSGSTAKLDEGANSMLRKQPSSGLAEWLTAAFH